MANDPRDLRHFNFDTFCGALVLLSNLLVRRKADKNGSWLNSLLIGGSRQYANGCHSNVGHGSNGVLHSRLDDYDGEN